MEEPKVGIILVNYNGYNDTIACVDSLVQIHYKNYCIYIVDNGSTNVSLKILKDIYKNHENVKIIDSGSNLGFSGGNNVGIIIAMREKSEYVLLLNNDTVVESDFLKPLVAEAELDSTIGIVTGKIKFFKQKEKLWFAGGHYSHLKGTVVHYGYGIEDIENYNVKKEVDFSTGCLMLIPIKVICNVGLLPEHYFLYCEDTEFSLRVLEYNYKIIYQPESVIYHKVSASTGSTSVLSEYYMVRNAFLVVRERGKGLSRISAYIYLFLQTLKRVLLGKYRLRVVGKAFMDFLNGEVGQLYMPLT